MATRFYLSTRSQSPKAESWTTSRRLSKTRGTALEVSDAVATANGTSVIRVTETSQSPFGSPGDLEFVSLPIQAVTISSSITINLWMAESNEAANCTAVILAGIMTGNLATSKGQLLQDANPGGGSPIELPVGTRAAVNWATIDNTIAAASGDRIIVQVKFGPVVSMVAGHTVTLGYGAPTAGADGDSWIEFAETVTELSQWSNVRIGSAN